MKWRNRSANFGFGDVGLEGAGFQSLLDLLKLLLLFPLDAPRLILCCSIVDLSSQLLSDGCTLLDALLHFDL